MCKSSKFIDICIIFFAPSALILIPRSSFSYILCLLCAREYANTLLVCMLTHADGIVRWVMRTYACVCDMKCKCYSIIRL